MKRSWSRERKGKHLGAINEKGCLRFNQHISCTADRKMAIQLRLVINVCASNCRVTSARVAVARSDGVLWPRDHSLSSTKLSRFRLPPEYFLLYDSRKWTSHVFRFISSPKHRILYFISYCWFFCSYCTFSYSLMLY